MSQKTLKKSIAGQDASRHQKSPRCPKKVKVAPMCRGKKQFIIRGVSHENVQKKISIQYELLHRPGKTPRRGRKIQPRSDSHQNIPVPLPSKQEEVKPNRHLGDMSAVKTVPEKEKEYASQK
jgi:hypothetical protein